MNRCFGGGFVSGRVIEESTGRPIDGAIVAVYWDGVIPIQGKGFSFHQRSFIGATLELMPFAGSRDDRVKELLRLSTQYCSGYPSSGFAAMKQAIGDEVEKLIRSRKVPS